MMDALSALTSPGGAGAVMVIDAKRIFTCVHTFVSVTDGAVLQFACAWCGYRTELLPLPRRQNAGPSQIASLSGSGKHAGQWSTMGRERRGAAVAPISRRSPKPARRRNRH